MKVNTPEFEQRMEKIVINNDASNTVISVNSLNFQIMVSDLTEEVKAKMNMRLLCLLLFIDVAFYYVLIHMYLWLCFKYLFTDVLWNRAT